MIPPPAEEPVSFREGISSGPFKWLFIVSVVLMFVGFIGAAIFNSMSPENYSGTVEGSGQSVFVVKESTLQPVTVSVSHTFPIMVVKVTPTPDNPDGYLYSVTDDSDPVNYNITIENNKDEPVYHQSEKLPMPFRIKCDENTHRYTVRNPHSVELRPGTYILLLDGSAKLDYVITERSSQAGATNAFVALGVVSVFLLVLTYIIVTKVEPRRKAGQAAVLAGAPHYPGQAGAPSGEYVPPALQNLKAQDWARAQSAYQDPARRSSLEYAPGQFFALVVCTRCGNEIHNPPVNGIVICEHCGEPGYIT